MSTRENGVNDALTKAAGLSDKVSTPGEKSFFETGMPDASCDVVLSQDALLHAGPERHRALGEAARILRPGGLMVFTDIMQSEEADPKDLQEVKQKLPTVARFSLAILLFVAREVFLLLESLCVRKMWARKNQASSCLHGGGGRGSCTLIRDSCSQVCFTYVSTVLSCRLTSWKDGTRKCLTIYSTLHLNSAAVFSNLEKNPSRHDRAVFVS